MKRALLVGLFLSYPALALAQAAPKAPAPPEFVPFTVEQNEVSAIKQWLLDQPAKFSIPVFNWLDSMEQQALKKSAADAAKKEPDKKEP